MVLHVATGMMCQVPAIQEVNPMTEPDTRKHNLFVLTSDDSVWRHLAEMVYGIHEDLA